MKATPRVLGILLIGFMTWGIGSRLSAVGLRANAALGPGRNHPGPIRQSRGVVAQRRAGDHEHTNKPAAAQAGHGIRGSQGNSARPAVHRGPAVPTAERRHAFVGKKGGAQC